MKTAENCTYNFPTAQHIHFTVFVMFCKWRHRYGDGAEFDLLSHVGFVVAIYVNILVVACDWAQSA